MIRFRNQVFPQYFINPENGEITDFNGVVQQINHNPPFYDAFKGMLVHQIQAHTIWGYKKGYDVHHKDGNIFNNALSNLDYISHEDHARITSTRK